MDSLEKKLNIILDQAHGLGLPEEDYLVSKQYLEYFEHRRCLDNLAEQLQEEEIKIDQRLYDLMEDAYRKMGVKEDSYANLKELIRQ